MSKIFEALQRAEQERLETQVHAVPAKAEVKAEPERRAERVVERVAERRETAAVRAVAPAAAVEAVETETGGAGEEVRGLGVADLEGIPTRVWTPVVDKLPALGESGNAVEQFRGLRSRLFSFRDLNSLKTVMVSSGMPEEGKSYVAANLAVSLARHRASRVLLIDGDMRRSSLHKLLGCPNTVGLTTYLTGQAGIAEVMQRADLTGRDGSIGNGLDSLTFIAGGDEGEKAADLSGSARFRHLIEEAEKYFDWIVVDSSPVNLVTDAVNLAAACDGVLLVVRGGMTKFESVQRAMSELKSHKVLGVVLNAVENPPVTAGYYGYDGYDSKAQ